MTQISSKIIIIIIPLSHLLAAANDDGHLIHYSPGLEGVISARPQGSHWSDQRSRIGRAYFDILRCQMINRFSYFYMHPSTRYGVKL
jgi:hypothetical protein